MKPPKRGRPSPNPATKAPPAPPPVRKPPVPPPPAPVRPPVSLSLPGGSAVFEPPPPAVPVLAPAPVHVPVAAPPKIPSEPASPHMIGSDSDNDDDWEPVTTAPPPLAASLPITAATNDFMNSPAMFKDDVFEEIDGDALFGDEGDGDNDGEDGDGDEGEGNDEDWLAGGLNETMEEVDPDEDFLGAVVERAEDPSPRQPIMSLNQYVDGGVTVHNDSDDDFTSSDESDDD